MGDCHDDGSYMVSVEVVAHYGWRGRDSSGALLGVVSGCWPWRGRGKRLQCKKTGVCRNRPLVTVLLATGPIRQVGSWAGAEVMSVQKMHGLQPGGRRMSMGFVWCAVFQQLFFPLRPRHETICVGVPEADDPGLGRRGTARARVCGSSPQCHSYVSDDGC